MQRYILLLIVLLCGGVAKGQTDIHCEYWFDRDYSERVSLDFSGEEFNGELDVEHLEAGLHTLSLHLRDTGQWSAPMSFMFFKPMSLSQEGESSPLTYKYWFDNSHESMQSLEAINGLILLPTDSLADGLHTLNLFVEHGNTLSSPQRYMFLKVSGVISDTDIASATYRCWFDRDYDSAQSGSVGNGTILLETEGLTSGLHTLNVLLEAGGTQTSTQSYMFVKVDNALSDTANGGTLAFSYWFDNDFANRKTGELQNGTILLETDSLPAGFHYVNIQVKDNDPFFLQRSLFYKEPLGGLGICKYEYWVNDDYEDRNIIEVNPPVSPYNLVALMPMDTVAFNQNSFVFEPRETTYPIVYSKNEVHFRFWNNLGHSVDTVRSYVDEQVYRDVIADTIYRNTTELIATPTGNNIHWFVLDADNGDSLAFKANHDCTLELYAPSGEKSMSVSGVNSTNWKGLNAVESGLYHLAVFSGPTNYANLNVSYNHWVSEFDTTLFASICEGTSYTENGFNESQAGTYTRTFQTVYGDSIVTLVLTVNPVYSTSLEASICQGGNYIENGFDIYNAQQSGLHTLNLQTENGCDSIVTLNLTVLPTYQTNISATICYGGDYDESGFNLTDVQESGVYTQNLQAVNGCDSIVTLTLTVNPVHNIALSATICEGTAYTENGFNVSEAGVYTQTIQTTQGCDSIVTLTLMVNPEFATSLSATICQGSDYLENGFALTNVQESGVHTLNLQTENGCDSVITLNLTVLPVEDEAITAVVCQGGDYVNHGFELYNLQTSGVYTTDVQLANGCTKTVTLSLTVLPSQSSTISATVCQGSNYTENGFELYNVQESGVYTVDNETANGCASTLTLNLTVNPEFETSLSATVCQGSDYTENGFNLTDVQESGEHTLNLQSVSGCDSIVTLTLTVNPTFATSLSAIVCQGADYLENGFVLTNVQESGEHTLNLETVNGCDSIVMLNLTVNPKFATPLTAIVCQGSDYTENGFNLTDVQESGVHTLNLETVNGCDSIVTLDLTVLPSYQTIFNAVISQGGDYTENGFDLTNVQASGVYTLNFQTMDGCDSIITLNLIVNPVYSTSLSATICQGSDYTDNGFNLTDVQESGVHTLNLETVNGYDSIVTLTLTVNPTFETSLSATVCQGTDYLENGFNLTNVQESGVYTQNLQSANGCDSIVTLNLTVNPVSSTEVFAIVCQGSDYTDNGFNLTDVQESGTHTLNLQSVSGCDSVVTLTLTVNPVFATSLEASVCQGSDYTENGFNLTNIQESGEFTQTLIAVSGCDSTVVLNLTVLPTYETTLEATINAGADYTENGFELTNVQESGTFTQTLTADNGCDSVIVLNLTVTSSLADKEEANVLSVVLYPNPAEDFATLRLENFTDSAELVVFDIQGKAIIRKDIAEGESEIRLDLSNLAAGTYSVRITSSEGVITRKLIRR